MSEPFLAEIRMWALNFAPRGWAFCDGTLLPIAQNTALFSLIGTTYGGDGRTTTAVPDLRERAPMHPGRGPGLTDRRLGERGGFTTATLTEQQIPSHSHAVVASDERGDDTIAVGNYPGTGLDQYGGATNATMAAGSLPATGGGGSHNNRQPYLTINFTIALTGLYPSRS